MYYPELDALCHEVPGQLSELRRLTMESPVLTEDQERLLAELTRLLRLVSAASSQQIHSLLGDRTIGDPEFLDELRGEFAILQEAATLLEAGHAPREAATPVLPPETPRVDEVGEPLEMTAAEGEYPRRWPLVGRDPDQQFASCDINGSWWLVDGTHAMRFASRVELDSFLQANWDTARAEGAIAWPPVDAPDTPSEVIIPDGMFELLYWDIQPVDPDDSRLLYARDSEQKWCLIVSTPEAERVALVFETEEARRAYLKEDQT